MKIAMITKSDASGGGASGATEELATGLINSGCELDVFIAARLPEMQSFHRPLYGSVARFLHEKTKWFFGAELVPYELPTLLRKIKNRYDVVHFQDLWGSASVASIGLAGEAPKKVFTLHDPSGFTGGCMYPMGCRRFETGCGACPQLSKKRKSLGLDFTAFNQRYRKAQYCGTGVQPVVTSRWMERQVKQSGVFERAPLIIPYGIDLEVFRPTKRSLARSNLGIPGDSKVILIAAHSLNDPRKGIDLAVEAVRQLDFGGLIVLLVGADGQYVREALPDTPVIHAGYVSSKRKLAQIYSAGDVFVFPTLEEAFGLVAIESMACGTPVAGFRVGGLEDTIANEKTGVLVEKGDVAGLAAGLARIVEPTESQRWRDRCVARARKLYSREQYVKAHLTLYGNLLR